MVKHTVTQLTDASLTGFLDSMVNRGGQIIYLQRHEPHQWDGRSRPPEGFGSSAVWRLVYASEQVDPKQQLADDVVAILDEPVSYAGDPARSREARIAQVRERIMR